MRNSSSLDWLRFMHTPNDYRVSPGEVLTSPKKDMYIMHGWEGKNKNM